MREFYSARHGARRRGFEYTSTDLLVGRLSNWQRKQWAAAGYPRDPDTLKRLARLQRDGTELYTGEILPPRQPPA